MKLDRYISELLFEHDCVIVPGFGGFVANPAPSRLDRIKQCIYPPRKEIGFNENLRNNDGLLANHIAGKTNSNYNTANDFISHETERWKKDLNETGRILIENIGILYKRKGQEHLLFEPDQSVNYLPESFGLQPLHIRPIPKTQRSKQDRPLVKPTAKSTSKRLITTVAALLPLLLYIAWLITGTDLLVANGHFTYSDFNPFVKKKCPLYTMREINPEKLPLPTFTQTTWPPPHDSAYTLRLYFHEDSLLLNLKQGIVVRLRTPYSPKPVSTYVKTNKQRKSVGYYVIGGCFKYLSNAKRLIRSLKSKGFNAMIVDRNKGLYRVAFDGYSSKQTAGKALKEIRESVQPRAWILRK